MIERKTLIEKHWEKQDLDFGIFYRIERMVKGTEKPNVHWSDLAGLPEGAIEALKETLILLVKFRHLFACNRVQMKTVLLYGVSF